jgi:hypothetical protein
MRRYAGCKITGPYCTTIPEWKLSQFLRMPFPTFRNEEWHSSKPEHYQQQSTMISTVQHTRSLQSKKKDQKQSTTNSVKKKTKHPHSHKTTLKVLRHQKIQYLKQNTIQTAVTSHTFTSEHVVKCYMLA